MPICTAPEVVISATGLVGIDLVQPLARIAPWGLIKHSNFFVAVTPTCQYIQFVSYYKPYSIFSDL